MHLIFALLAFFIGGLLNVQAGVNGLLRETTANPIFASTVNFTVALILMLVLLIITTRGNIYELPRLQQLEGTRWWMWLGGPLGIIFVMASALLPAYIGYGAFFSMLVTGQLLFSALTDHKGWLGNQIRRIDRRRAAGIVLLLVGAVIVQNT